MRAGKLLTLIILMLAAAVSCSKDNNTASGLSQTKKIAVILPMQDGLGEHWKRTAELYENELRRAMAGNANNLRIDMEFYDEDTEDIEELVSALCDRNDIDAIVGGLRSSDAAIIAKECSWEKMTFFTLATTEELIRAHSSDGYLWAMTETDITQCEVLLSRAIAQGAGSVSLIANGSDAYGKTFVDWFAFQAQELGLEIKGLYVYTGSNLEETAEKAVRSGADAIICVPSAISDVAPMARIVNRSGKIILFSDTAYGANVLELMGEDAEGMEGVAFTSNPESGFDVTYKVYFNDTPTLGESQFYDALLLLGYGFYYQMIKGDISLRQALRDVVDGRDAISAGWMYDGMSAVFNKMDAGGTPDISGASGSLDFDSKVYTNVLSTTYCHFKVYMGKYLILDYFNGDGSNRTYGTLAGWNWKADDMQDIVDGTDITYPELDRRWALLVASSDRWEDYRFQADVLDMYQTLKKAGYDDDHIVLIMEDNIAYDSRNPYQGTVKTSPDGENLYCDVHVDYKLSDISYTDLENIMAGRQSEKLPHVIKSDRDDNILVFWSGHGMPGVLNWGYTYSGLTPDDLRNMFAGTEYRKLLCFFEACYSGGMVTQCRAMPGALFFTAANEFETSKADVFDSQMNIWLSNRFSLSLRDAIKANPEISFKELYYHLFINTVGSHVMIYNNEYFGNLVTNNMKEFVGVM